MLTITVELLHGTIRAGSPDDTVAAGGGTPNEWPPSPARLFSALVAGGGTREHCRFSDGAELIALESLGAPRVFADPVGRVETTAMPPRFVPKDTRAQGTVQDYPARANAPEVRPGVKASPQIPRVAYVWDEDVEPAHLAALRARAARVGYLGCADSPARVGVSSEVPIDGLAEWRPGAKSGVALPVPYVGFTAALDAAFDTWSAGEPMKRSWIPTRRERYSPGDVSDVDDERASVVWLEFDERVIGRRSLVVAETLRDAVLSHVDRRSTGDKGRPGRRAPWVLHGHGVPREVAAAPYQLARYLPLANVGHSHADGAIHGAAIWLPPGTPTDIVEDVREAVSSGVRRLRGPGVDISVHLRAGPPGRGKRSTQPRRWEGPTRRWFSVTPAVAERGRRGGPTVDDVCGWFDHAGHPVPVAVRVSPVPTQPGVERLRPNEVHHARGGHPYVWLEVEFGELVEGPLCVGRGRSFGMGLLAPRFARASADATSDDAKGTGG